jgi:ubiquinone/menaquinone biosynthesis C-methylase UbiE
MVDSRDASVYADFLLPHLTQDAHLVDVGCGSGELSVDLARSVRWITGVDSDPAAVEAARRTAEAAGSANVHFAVGDAYALDMDDNQVDAVLAHSVLETLGRPAAALFEAMRVLRPGGVVAVASVEYSGLILAGPHAGLTRRFYDIRERLWQLNGADPFRGRNLRGLLLRSGYVGVEATTKTISYGTNDAVEEFGCGRAADCADVWYVSSAIEHGLATPEDLAAMRQAWLEWSRCSASYAAFAWCRALGRKP